MANKYQTLDETSVIDSESCYMGSPPLEAAAAAAVAADAPPTLGSPSSDATEARSRELLAERERAQQLASAALERDHGTYTPAVMAQLLRFNAVEEVVALKHVKTPNADERILYHAAASGDADKIRQLLQAGTVKVDVQVSDIDAFGDDNYITPLMLACKYKQVEAVRVLMEFGARTNLESRLKHRYAIHYAARPVTPGDGEDVTALAYQTLELILASADTLVNAYDAKGDTALHYLVSAPHYFSSEKHNLVDLLAKHGASAVKNNNGESPLDYIHDKVARKELSKRPPFQKKGWFS